MLSSLIAAMAAAGAIATAPAPAASAQTGAQAAPPAEAKLVCRSTQVTGSRLGGKRICHTQDEWNALTHESREVFDNQLRRGMQVQTPVNIAPERGI